MRSTIVGKFMRRHPSSVCAWGIKWQFYEDVAAAISEINPIKTRCGEAA